MVLDVETPAQPDLTNRPVPSVLGADEVSDSDGDLRRAELEGALADGAWSDAFHEWTEYTDLTESEITLLADAGCFEEVDFFWDPTEGRIRHEVPTIAPTRDIDADLADSAETELAELCDLVVETLDDAYLDWDADSGVEEPWTDETFDDESPEE
ncbi:hypothetical protein [Halobaculum roseum]|uniref:DUF7992 domain-containing protein n=1 Tax=Halobaculum roseum TaxID=2175149 RepID=A0ABD5MR04_9EURY|nr:hypothetical protein [Halobaculum roseum]QZY04669.1 hypothetical protein K6T36_17090 [Halobaculum roseum]